LFTVTPAALLVASWFATKHWRNARRLLVIAAVLNLFFAVWITAMGTGHLLGVSAKALLGILPDDIRLWVAIPFGLMLVLPGALLVHQTRKLTDENARHQRSAIWLNTCLTAVLVVPAAPLIVLPLLNIGLLLAIAKRPPVVSAAV
jgi:hypothetical protein